MKWIISTGHELRPHSAHESLDAALRCVHDRLLRGTKLFDSIQWQASTGDDQGFSDGTLTLLSWELPSRKMTIEEIADRLNSSAINKRTATAWKKNPPNVTDWARAENSVEFIGERFASISVCREDRHRQYLHRAAICNDVTARLALFEAMVSD